MLFAALLLILRYNTASLPVLVIMFLLRTNQAALRLTDNCSEIGIRVEDTVRALCKFLFENQFHVHGQAAGSTGETPGLSDQWLIDLL